MFIPLVDILRCPTPHDETWLVASIDRAEERDIIEGMLGCPICLAEYPIRDGIVYFAERRAPIRRAPPDETEAMRLAAALDLTDARMTAVLQGAWGAHAQLVRGVSPAQLLLLNPPARHGERRRHLDRRRATSRRSRSVGRAPWRSTRRRTSAMRVARRSLRAGGRMLGAGVDAAARRLRRARARRRGLGRAARRRGRR